MIVFWLLGCAPKPASTEPSKKPPIPLTAIPKSLELLRKAFG